jgi:sigma-B regulation protein RsbU (phosphoserine phosphatase)
VTDFPSPLDEDARLQVVRRYAILDTPGDGTFDGITALAAKLFDAPIAVVSIVDAERIWFKSHHGLDQTEIPRTPGLCASAILTDDVYVVPDARLDPVARTNPLVTGELGVRFYAAAPLRTADGQRLGTLCVIDRVPRQLDERARALLSDLGELVVRELELRLQARTAVAAEARLRAEAESRRRESDELARALQAALLPHRLPSIPGVDLAVRYRPADGARVGGDFYDVFALPRRAWGIAIGDVCGKGPKAAAVTGAARHALRGAAIDHDSPAEVLRLLNHTLLIDEGRDGHDDTSFCTVVYARLRPHGDAFHLSVASGGHPLPHILRAGGRMEPIGGGGSLVGSFADATFTERSARLRPGDTVVFFTDGVTEATVGEQFLGREGVLQHLGESVGRSPSAIAQRLTDVALSSGRQRDDVAILVLRIRTSTDR